ncbi:MAG: RNase adapter RapZ [Vulcanimicrobiaceae bacterium]
MSRVVFLAGPAGAGRSQAIKTFEDLGFYCVEHLPPAALGPTLETLDRAKVRDIAVTLDINGESTLGDPLAAIAAARTRHHVTLAYLDASDEALVRRFSETRRRHPLAAIGSLRDAITAERALLMPLREHADVVIDTTELTLGGLKQRLATAFGSDERPALALTIVPFGFKYGLPLDIDLLFDVRFLRNPNYDDTLRALTGDDRAVAEFIEADAACSVFLEKVVDLLDFLIPQYISEGKAHLTIGVGCTGGRHRSVYIANRIREHLAGDARLALAIDARDVVR